MRRRLLRLSGSLIIVLMFLVPFSGFLCKASDEGPSHAQIGPQEEDLTWNWTVETVDDDTDVGIISAVVLDSYDTPIILYQDGNNKRIKQAEKRNGQWQIEVIHSRARLAFVDSPLDMDSRDRLHLAFNSINDYPATYGIRDNGSWQFQDLFPEDYGLWLDSIAVDPQDLPHFGTTDGATVLHIYNDGDEWRMEEASPGPPTSPIFWASIAVDPQSRVHMSYLDNHEVSLNYALKEGDSWRNEFVDDQDSPSSIAVTSKGEPHILYWGPHGCRCLRHAYKVGDSWKTEDLPFAHSLGSIVIDSFDIPHITFASNVTLGYAFLNEGTWEWQLVEEARGATEMSLALDSHGRPHISFYDASRRNLMYATPSEGPISADIDIDPDTLNLKSRGRFVTAYIELEGADVRDIDASTINLNDIVSPVLDERYGFVTSEDSYIIDHDEDGMSERMVKFWRSEVQEILDVGPLATITVSGNLDDGTPFEGTDEIRVIDPSKLNQPKVAMTGSGYSELSLRTDTSGIQNREEVRFPPRDLAKSKIKYARIAESGSFNIRLQFQDNPVIR